MYISPHSVQSFVNSPCFGETPRSLPRFQVAGHMSQPWLRHLPMRKMAPATQNALPPRSTKQGGENGNRRYRARVLLRWQRTVKE